jgi:hypothetical protein
MKKSVKKIKLNKMSVQLLGQIQIGGLEDQPISTGPCTSVTLGHSCWGQCFTQYRCGETSQCPTQQGATCWETYCGSCKLCP